MMPFRAWKSANVAHHVRYHRHRGWVVMFGLLVLLNFSVSFGLEALSRGFATAMATRAELLPEEASPVQKDVFVVRVSLDRLTLDGKELPFVDDAETPVIPSLEEALRTRREANGGQTGEVLIQAERRVQFRVVKRIMLTCAAAGYADISFATLRSTISP